MKWILPIVAALLLSSITACDQRAASGATAPAHVDNPVTEAALTTITLTPEAVQRLGVETARVERRDVRLTRALGGDLLVPPGHRMTVSAPTAALVRGGRNGEPLPAAGARLDRQAAIMELVPLPPDSELLAVREQIAVREAELVAARARAERAEQLLAGGAGSQETLEDARAVLARAEAALRVTRSQQGLLLGNESDALTAVTMVAPEGGVLSALHVAVGQVVSQGTPLFDVELQDELWVKVPIYSGDLASINPQASASVSTLGAWPGPQGHTARPISGPPTADSQALSTDLFYALENSGGAFRAGERVQVTLTLRTSGEHLVVPWSAIFRDIHGGAWVYEQTAPGTYVRRRVNLQQISDQLALLADGPAPGAEVVTVGVAELVGTEFGVAH